MRFFSLEKSRKTQPSVELKRFLDANQVRINLIVELRSRKSSKSFISKVSADKGTTERKRKHSDSVVDAANELKRKKAENNTTARTEKVLKSLQENSATLTDKVVEP